MRRHTAPWLVAAFLLSASSASAKEVNNHDAFSLWAACVPVALEVGMYRNAEGKLVSVGWTLKRRCVVGCVRPAFTKI